MNVNKHSWKVARRLRALELKRRGWSQTKIAEAMGVSNGAVSQWMRLAREQGEDALKGTAPPGRPRKLDGEQTGKLKELLKQGPHAFGFSQSAWTSKTIALFIDRRFQVSYHSAHIPRLMKRIGLPLNELRRLLRDRVEEPVKEAYSRRDTWGDSGPRDNGPRGSGVWKKRDEPPRSRSGPPSGERRSATSSIPSSSSLDVAS